MQPKDRRRTRRRWIRLGLIVLPLAIVVVLISPRWLPLLRSVFNEQRWKAEQIRDYRIHVTRDDAWWVHEDVELLVHNGRVVLCARRGKAISCPDYSVSGLFDLANKTSLDLTSCLKVEFDPSFHYPSRIDTSCRYVSDSGWTLQVTSFEPMKVLEKLPDFLLLSAESAFQEGKLTRAKQLVAETVAVADAEFEKTESFKKLIGLAAQIAREMEAKQTGYWVDGDTRLMWTRKVNGERVDWHRAGQYCEALTLGGYHNWRLPSIDELNRMYVQAGEKGIKSPIEIPQGDLVWSGTMNGSSEAWYQLFSGGRGSGPLGSICPAFCVRVAE